MKAEAVAWMPPREPMDMPVQDFSRASASCRIDSAGGRTIFARLVTFGGAALLTVIASAQIAALLAPGGLTAVEAAVYGLCALSFAWIAVSATSALAGVITPAPAQAQIQQTGSKLKARTAIVMPIFHEDPVRTTAGLAAMASGLNAHGQARYFEIVVLSDSTAPEVWTEESLSVRRLRQALQDIMPVWYRRRAANTGRKPGNIKEFIENWGGRYEYFILLDADSLMAPKCLATLVGAMEADPQLGILQVAPALSDGRTLFARLQQFAARIHGPTLAQGIAAWQGSDGIYWGHNAIIRTAAFAASCGLPRLPGKRPIGGEILSHDYVEGALMRRAGWRVELAPGLAGAWEESPPSLLDAAARDRRWLQGNLQHTMVITASGLAPISRVHLAMGILSYAAAPVWLMLMIGGIAVRLEDPLPSAEVPHSGQAASAEVTLDPAGMPGLLFLTMAVLLLPKLIGLGRALITREVREGCGGTARLTASWLAETMISALIAPIIMAIHTRHLCEVLAGRDIDWEPQRRSCEAISLVECWRRHQWETLFGTGLALSAAALSSTALAWAFPAATALLIAVPISKASGSAFLGEWLRRCGLFTTPEEVSPDPILAARARLCASVEGGPPDLRECCF